MVNASIVLGGGCFWCLEAVFQRVQGIETVTSGYSGGDKDSPSYKRVMDGTTGHAEVVKVAYNPALINLETILKIFWTIHNPTTRNQQGNDIGTQYRSVIFYNERKQQNIATQSLQEVAQPLWDQPIVTEIQPLKKFYPAEDYHQNYFNNHPEQAYCQIVINPKVSKLKKQFATYLKD